MLELTVSLRSLDPEANRTFQSIIKDSLRGRTVIAVEHNPYNVLEYDRVVVLQAGQVIETGAPSELAKVDSAFRRLLRQAR
jgi:ABC-type transport system involved in cytochrome bd biosynthesis fused ATPase/permease subunit